MTAILAPLRGVTVKSFRAAFAREIKAARFCESVTPFITAVQGYDPLKDRELSSEGEEPVPVVPQFIGKDPAALEHCLERIKDAGYDRADLNCGCPFPMVRKKFRGSGIMKTPDILAKMTETGVKIMGEGRFSVKMRLGGDSPGNPLCASCIEQIPAEMDHGACENGETDVFGGMRHGCFRCGRRGVFE